ncbi:MAG: ABC transporter substrate-binding protein [Dehalococcoidia bacterium]|nr:ABC transporter substrate-binding protein [Dehalococcoidia bacterium]
MRRSLRVICSAVRENMDAAANRPLASRDSEGMCMRKLLFPVLAIATAMALVLSACGGGDDGDSSSTSPKATSAAPKVTAPPKVTGGPKRYDILRVSLSGTRDVFDPIKSGADIKNYLAPMYDSIIGNDLEGVPDTIHGLATSWTAAADNTSLTIKLRTNAKFHDGTPVTADDVKFTIERASSKDSVSSWAADYRASVKSVDVVDASTVRLNYAKPAPFFYFYLTRRDSAEPFVVSKAYVEKNGLDVQNTKPMGSGPYKFVEHVQGAHTLYDEVATHWMGRPNYNQVRIAVVAEDTTRVSLLKTKATDIIDSPRSESKSLKSAGLTVTASPITFYLELWVNRQWDTATAFSDVRVREALSIAVNRQELIDTLFSGAGQLPDYFPNTTVSIAYHGGAKIPYDPARARQLLQAAYPNGITVSLFSYGLGGISEGPQMMQAIAGYWEKVGVKTKIVSLEYQAMRAQMVNRDPNLANSVGWIRVAPLFLPHPGLNVLARSNGALALSQDPTLDKMIDDLSNELDLARYKTRTEEITRYIEKNHMRFPVADVQQLFASNPDKVRPDWKLGRYTSDLYLNGLFFNNT